MPSYHCEAMVEPVTWLGAEPVFFRIEEILSVDLVDISRHCDPKIRAVIAVHYFGFPQDFFRVRRILRKRRHYLD